MNVKHGKLWPVTFSLWIRDLLVTLMILGAALCLCLVLRNLKHTDAFAAMLFILAVFLVARFTRGYLFGVLSAIISVLAVNFVFTYPYFQFNFTLTGYPLTIVCMLAVSIITSALTTQAKHQEELRMEVERERIHGNLLRAISHDLRTPLTVILGANGTMLENANSLSPEQRERLLSEVNDEAEWLIRVVENLLAVTRIDGPAALNKQPEVAEELVAAAVQKFKRHFPGQQVSVSVPDELLLVPVDAVLIEQVLINLLENAAQHAEGSTGTHIAVSRLGGYAEFTVEDSGCGIEKSQLDKLFSGDCAGDREQTPGGHRSMGIGLSVCSSIVKAHGGEMNAKNKREGGALFRFVLPLEGEK